MSEAENDAALSLQRILRADLTDLPPLPRYEDDENQYFHAVAFAAAEIAFRSMGMTTQFRAIPQYSTLAGPADMVIVDASAVPWLPIEIKKYPGDVRGKGRRQANDYRDNMRGSRTELYVSTNLEAFEIFLFDPNRPSVAAQILKTEFRDVGSLELARLDEEARFDFYFRLCSAFVELMQIALELRPAVYDNSFFGLMQALNDTFDDDRNWHRQFVPLSFDIVRSSGLFSEAAQWRPSSYYRSRPQRLIDVGSRIDFELIFAPPAPHADDVRAFDDAVSHVVDERAGDPTVPLEVSAIVHDQVLRRSRHSGVVETDSDLARLLARLGRKHLVKPIVAGDRVLDPCAGTGALLVAFAETSSVGERLDASQLVAVEIEPRFAEILDLRLGLAYSDGLSPTNRPAITIGDFSDIAQTALTDVSLVLVNPPFQSRARSMSSDHVDFLRFISAIAQAAEEHPAVKSARLTGGQHGLEKLFLELLALRAKPGTTVAAIIPKKLLTAPGRDGDAFRAFLLDTFGLREIFTYPSTDLFSEFVVETAIIVGRIPVAGECDWQIEATQLLHTVPQLRGKRIRPGVNAVSEITSRGALGDRLRDWRDTLMPAVGALLEEIRGVAADRPEPYRGTYGNLGLSGELAFRNPEHVAAFGAFPVPLQRSGEPPRLFSAMTTAEWTIAAEDATAFTEERLASLWRTIHYTPGARTPQKKRLKTEHELPRILGLSRTTREIALLIPRAQRAVGQISIFVPTPQHPRAVISTNYLILEQESVQKAKVLGSWLLSVFGQLMLEYFSKPERGLRKLESEGVRRVVLPNLSKIPAVVQRQLSELFDIEEAIRFGPEERRTPRDVDRVWAQVLFEDRAQQLLAAAYDGLEELLRDRHQGR